MKYKAVELKGKVDSDPSTPQPRENCSSFMAESARVVVAAVEGAEIMASKDHDVLAVLKQVKGDSADEFQVSHWQVSRGF
jgi:hypothetical protein